MEWTDTFLALLKEGKAAHEAARMAGTSFKNASARRNRHPDFARAWAECEVVVETRKAPVRLATISPDTKRGAGRLTRFIDELAASSNVSAAAAAAGLSVSQVYKLRRDNPEFARRWFAALAEGYDNLEMELLGRLRAGDADQKDAGKAGAKFDTAAALRCLAAHRESVAREKGRRALADEVITIASINEKIDKLRLAGEAGAKAIREAQRAKAKARRRPDAEPED